MIKSFKRITFISLIKNNSKDSKILIKYLQKNKIYINHIIADGSKKKQNYLCVCKM